VRPSDALRRSARFEAQVRADLAQRRWLRVHALLLGSVCFLACWAISANLMAAGVDRLSLRWGAAMLGGYLVFLGLLWLWCRWLLSREESDGDLPIEDVIDLVPSGRSGGRPEFEPGGGGDFGGGGASGSFDVGDAAQGAGRVAGEALEAAASADEGIVVAIPLAVVVGIAALIASILGVAVFGLFGVEVLLGVAVEIAIAAAGGALAFRARREGWLMHALGRTWRSAFVLLVLVVALGAVVDTWLPQADSLPQALRLLRS
jgi:hypothetical protein